jgi:Protein of unknown function (DUF1499)
MMQIDDTNNTGHISDNLPNGAPDDVTPPIAADTVPATETPPLGPTLIVESAPVVPAKPKKDWIGSLLVLVSVGFGLWAAIAAYGAGWNAWSRDAGIAQLYMAAIASVVVAFIAILFIWGARKRGWYQSYTKRLLALFISLGLVGYLGSWWLPSVTKPALHDISTTMADPPVFRTILLRDDNWDMIPEADNSDFQGLSPRQRWAQIHQEAYPDIRTVRVEQSATLLMEKAERLAIARGWDIKDLEAADGRIEASTTTSPMAYPHNIAIRIRPAEGGNGAIVDMRAVSGEGQHDLGTNAEIIRSFLADLSGTTSGPR